MVFALSFATAVCVMPINDYDGNSFFGRDDVANAIIQHALDAQADTQHCRSLLIEGPANRGKSWLLCRVRERCQLTSPQAPQAQSHGQPANPPQVTSPVAVCLFTKDHAQSLDLYDLVARLWAALYPCVPALLWPQSILDGDEEEIKVRKLSDFFHQSPSDAARLIEVVIQELEGTRPPAYLVVLVDGLDEFERGDLERFEREFLSPLFRSSRVRLIASRRSEVVTHTWKSYLVRLHTHLRPLEAFPAIAAEQQVDNRFQHAGSPLRFATDLRPLFKFYEGQNPGANTFFVRCALSHRASGHRELVTYDEIKACVLELSRSGQYTTPIADQDFEWLNTIVKQFPEIGKMGAPRHEFNPVLNGISDKERNDWLGRLQERGIVVVELNGLCKVHEEFVALCQEWEARRTP